MKDKIENFFKYVDIFTGIVIGLMVFFVFLNVVLRVFFNSGLTWSEELSRYLFVFVTYVGSISAMRSNSHLGVDTLIIRMNKKVQLFLYVLTQIIISSLMGLLIHGTINMMQANGGQQTAALGIPLPVLYSMGLLMGVSITIIAIANIVYAIKNPEEISELVSLSGEEEGLIEDAAEAAEENLKDLQDIQITEEKTEKIQEDYV